MLVRLHAENFDFSQCREDGGDIRFVNKHGTPLPCEIEHWDAGERRAAIWVNVDTVSGNDSTQWITLYWGNPGAAGTSDGAAVFDTADGYSGVWHLDMGCNDATANGHHGVSCSASDTTGAIGGGKSFSGTDSIVIPGLLGAPVNITLSAWARLDSAPPDGGGEILSVGDAVLIRMDYTDNGIGTGGAIHKTDTVFNHTASGRFLEQTGWHLVTFTYDESAYASTLYIDGVAASSRTDPGIPIDYSNVGSTTCIGIHGNGKTRFNFTGRIDEVRVYRTAVSADFIRLCHMNQGEADRLVKFR